MKPERLGQIGSLLDEVDSTNAFQSVVVADQIADLVNTDLAEEGGEPLAMPGPEAAIIQAPTGQSSLSFTLSHQRDTVGQRLTVKVGPSPGLLIARVTTRLDGLTLADDPLAPAEVQYEREFGQAGTGGPGSSHVLLVTATDTNGTGHTASQRWTDKV